MATPNSPASGPQRGNGGRPFRDLHFGAVVAGLLLAAGCHTQAPVPPPKARALDETQALLAKLAMPPAPWNAQWIGTGQDQPNSWACFRTTFSLPSAQGPAIARVAADTKYWLWVNGTLVVREGGLKRGPAPGGTYFDEVDLAPHLRAGSNTLAILHCFFGKDGFSHANSGKAGLLFELRTPTTVVASDADWRALTHPGFGTAPAPLPNPKLAESNILFDGAKDLPGWTAPGFDDHLWPRAKVLGQPGEAPWGALRLRPIPLWPDNPLQAFAKVAVTGDQVEATLPFNQRFTVWFELEAGAGAGAMVDLRTDTYLVGKDATIRAGYLTREGRQSFETLGWFSGAKAILSLPAGTKLLDLRFRPHTYPAAAPGAFRCSDPFFERLWTKALRTLTINMVDSWTDCPDRERAPWIGDVVIEAGQTSYCLDPRATLLTRKAYQELVDWRRPDGTLFSPVPSGSWSWELPLQSLAALSQFGPLNYHQDTGDLALLAHVYPAARAYLLDLWSLQPNGLVDHRNGDWPWADWGDGIDYTLLENVWYLDALEATARMAVLVGHGEEAPRFQARADQLRNAFQSAFWTGSAYRSASFQGSPDDRGNALAVLAGLARPEQREALLAVLTTSQQASPYMERYVLEALCRLGAPSAALARMKDRYAAMVDDPGTTLFEAFPKVGTNNHGWSGGVITVLARHILGLRPTAPGFASFEVVPQPGDLASLGLTTPTRFGPLAVDLGQEAGTFTLSLTVPEGTTAVGCIPIAGPGDSITINGKVDLSPGATLLPSTTAYHRFRLGPGQWTLRRQAPASGQASLIPMAAAPSPQPLTEDPQP